MQAWKGEGPTRVTPLLAASGSCSFGGCSEGRDKTTTESQEKGGNLFPLPKVGA